MNLLLSMTTSLLLTSAAGMPQAEVAAPNPPSWQVVVPSDLTGVPTDGVLVLEVVTDIGSFTDDDVTLEVRDAEGLAIPGAAVLDLDHAAIIWTGDHVLEANAVYDVDLDLYNPFRGSPDLSTTFEFSTGGGPASALAAPVLGEPFFSGDSCGGILIVPVSGIDPALQRYVRYENVAIGAAYPAFPIVTPWNTAAEAFGFYLDDNAVLCVEVTAISVIDDSSRSTEVCFDAEEMQELLGFDGFGCDIHLEGDLFSGCQGGGGPPLDVALVLLGMMCALAARRWSQSL